MRSFVSYICLLSLLLTLSDCIATNSNTEGTAIERVNAAMEQMFQENTAQTRLDAFQDSHAFTKRD